MSTILFICTGNIFRSMTAEYALRAALASDTPYSVRSAGIQADPMEMYEPVRQRLKELRVDPSGHRQTRLTDEILADTDLAVAMGLNHQTFVKAEFGRGIPLFNQVAYGRDEPILDIGEAMPDWKDQPDLVPDYARDVVDEIWSAMPDFIERMDQYTR